MDTDRLHPFTGSDPDGENHWWLEDVNTNQRFDLTSAQYSKTFQCYDYVVLKLDNYVAQHLRCCACLCLSKLLFHECVCVIQISTAYYRVLQCNIV